MRFRDVFFPLVLFCLCGLLARSASAASDADWTHSVKVFREDFRKDSIKFKQNALNSLPLDDERTISFIIEKMRLLQDKNWWIRSKAAERLSMIHVPKLRKVMLSYATDSHVDIREGIIAGLAMNHDRMDVPVILAALKDKDARVRRMACWAAGTNRIREAVPTMIDMIHSVDKEGKVVQVGEVDPRTEGAVLYNLGEITGQTQFFTDVDQWRAYWKVNKDRRLPPVKRFDVGSFGQIKLNYNDTFARMGTGPLVFVLPMPNLTTNYYMPYFSNWLFVKWLFVNLPPIKSFPGVQKNEKGDDIYPVDILVDAFEDMRKKRHVDKAIILAQGFSTWIAAKYAQKYPDHVEGLILLNPYADNKTYGRRIQEAIRSGNPDAELWGKVSSYQQKLTNATEQEVYNYYVYSAFIHNKADIELAMLRRIWKDPGAQTIAIPEFDIKGEGQSHIPTLMFFAQKNNNLSGYEDIGRLRHYYVKSGVVKLRHSERLPFMEEPEFFEKALRAFLDKYHLE